MLSESKVTIIIPVKNDAENLRRCLDNIPAGLKCLVVDSNEGSSSELVAREFGADHRTFDWNGGFPKKRNWILWNYNFETDWVFFLDTDEFPGSNFWEELDATLSKTIYDGFWLNYNNYFMGKPLRYGDPCPKLALFRTGRGEYVRMEEDYWSDMDIEVHDHPIIKGTVGVIKTPIEHKDFRGISHWANKHNSYSDWEACRFLYLAGQDDAEWTSLTERQRFKYQNLNKWWFPLAYFLGTYVWKKGFLDGASGFRLALLKAYYFFIIQLKIREKQTLANRHGANP